jgi:hypothetical protein
MSPAITEVSIRNLDIDAQRKTMPLVSAILFALVIILPSLLAGFISFGAAIDVAVVVIVSTSLWMSVDAWLLDIRSYETDFAVHPFVLLTAGLALWVVIFPGYLVIRSRIFAGQLAKAKRPPGLGSVYMCVVFCCFPVVMYFAGSAIPALMVQ